jgi:hypothetical protein
MLKTYFHFRALLSAAGYIRETGFSVVLYTKPCETYFLGSRQKLYLSPQVYSRQETRYARSHVPTEPDIVKRPRSMYQQTLTRMTVHGMAGLTLAGAWAAQHVLILGVGCIYCG